MLLMIVKNTPPWVWGLLVAVLALGIWQALPRRMSARRLAIVPLVLLGLSFAGILSTFHAALVPLAAWVAGLAAVLAGGLRWIGVRGARWDAANATFHVPGSAWPLVFILALFLVKYGVGVSLALHPELARDLVFDAVVGLAYGGFSGYFLARSAALWRLARRPATIAA
jgi:hypothetical protein